jgi:hypothetical protein
MPVVEWKATYKNEKEYFVNDQLNANLNLVPPQLDFAGNSTTPAGADYLMGFMSLGQAIIDGEYTGHTYSESVFPKSINLYRPYVRGRTTYKSFWRDSRIARAAGVPTLPRSLPADTLKVLDHPPISSSQGSVIPTSSIWPLDARLEFDMTSDGTNALRGATEDAPYVWVASGSNFEITGTTPSRYGRRRGGGEGELMNSLTTVHTPYLPAHPWNKAGGGTNLLAAMNPNRYAITASAMYARRHTLLTGTSVLPWSSRFGPADPAHQCTFPTSVVPFAGDAPWDAGNQSGKFPFYDSYDDYTEHMRLHGKDYSIIPEYRMSEHMEDYIVNSIDPFTDPALFSLTGAAPTITSSLQDNFYKT